MENIENINNAIYYSNHELLTRNALFNFIIGERGNGKTYSFKKWSIDDFLKNKNEFVWIRRYDTELDDIGLFFNDIRNQYPTHEFEVKGGCFYIDKKVAGYYFPLSKAITKKSIPYPNVTKIIFDEFIIDKGSYHYLPKEVDLFLEVVETISRLRDVRCFLIANSISEINPYFTYFNLRCEGRFTKFGDILVEKTQSLHYREVKRNTRFGKIINNTDYGRYAIDNEFIRDNHEFIEKKPENAKNLFNIVVNKKTLGIWADSRNTKIYASFKYNPSLVTLSLTTDDMRPNMFLLKGRSYNLTLLKNAITYGFLYYESFKVKAQMLDVIKLINIR